MSRVALIGWPVAHSLSPVMHDAAFAALDMDWQYVLRPAEPGRLAEALEELRSGGLAGANVTVPHKQAVMEHVDRLDAAAAAIGAVNTLSVSPDGILTGANTDGDGFLADLRESGFDPAGTSALVIGAGGAARAVVHALSTVGAHDIAVLGRSGGAVHGIEVGPFPGGLADRLGQAHLVVNCTPLGMAGHETGADAFEDAPFSERHLVYDLVYSPAPTPLLESAARCGARALDGLGMLVRQGALSFEIWTGVKPPLDVMRRAAENGPGAG